jgi:hypothetical protein
LFKLVESLQETSLVCGTRASSRYADQISALAIRSRYENEDQSVLYVEQKEKDAMITSVQKIITENIMELRVIVLDTAAYLKVFAELFSNWL